MNDSAERECHSHFSTTTTTLAKLFAAALTLIKLQPDLPAQFRNKHPHTASVL